MHQQRMKFSDELNHGSNNARKELAKADSRLNCNVRKFEALGVSLFPPKIHERGELCPQAAEVRSVFTED
jgi:hypothetical protein